MIACCYRMRPWPAPATEEARRLRPVSTRQGVRTPGQLATLRVRAWAVLLHGLRAPSSSVDCAQHQDTPNSTDCLGCPASTYCPEGTATPIPCPPGTQQPEPGIASIDSCRSCPPGFWVSAGVERTGPSHEWQIGLRQNALLIRSFGCVRPCTQCTTGTAIPCTKDTYNSISGRESTDQTACTPCPEHATTGVESATGLAVTNATSFSQCRCRPGYFKYEDAAHHGPNFQCRRCPNVGCDCDSQPPGVMIDTLPILPGHWRPSAGAARNHARHLSANLSGFMRASIDVRRCPDASTNCSGLPACRQTTSGCRGGHDSEHDQLCHPGLSGVFCRTCVQPANGMRFHYSRASETEVASCKQCGYEGPLAVSLILAALVAAVSVAGGRCARARTAIRSGAMSVQKSFVGKAIQSCLERARARRQSSERFVWSALVHHFKWRVAMRWLKILLGVLVIAVRIDVVYEVELPPLLRRLMSSISISIHLGIGDVGWPLECYGLVGYHAQLVFFIATPIVLTLLIVVLSMDRIRLRRLLAKDGPWDGRKYRKWRHELTEAALPWILRMLFFAYPLVTNMAFDAFPCHRICHGPDVPCRPQDVHHYLKADLSIECHTAEHHRVMSTAYVAISLYPVGVLLLCAWLLWQVRTEMHSSTSERRISLGTGRAQARELSALYRATAFLHLEYHPSIFWWELLEMFRRLVLLGVLLLLSGNALQLCLGTLVCACFLLLQVQLRPHASPYDNFLATAGSFALLVMLIVCSAFKHSELADLAKSQADVLRQKESGMVTSSFAAAAIFATVLLGMLVMSLIVCVMRIRVEWLDASKSWMSLRRLRLLEGDVTVALSNPIHHSKQGASAYHIFLSRTRP